MKVTFLGVLMAHIARPPRLSYPSEFQEVPSSTKSAFTRAFNKSGMLAKTNMMVEEQTFKKGAKKANRQVEDTELTEGDPEFGIEKVLAPPAPCPIPLSCLLTAAPPGSFSSFRLPLSSPLLCLQALHPSPSPVRCSRPSLFR